MSDHWPNYRRKVEKVRQWAYSGWFEARVLFKSVIILHLIKCSVFSLQYSWLVFYTKSFRADIL